MPEEMVERATRYAEDAVTKFSLEIDMASYVKRLFDKKYEPSWHVVVGR
jgi:dynein light chain LC8-type